MAIRRSAFSKWKKGLVFWATLWNAKKPWSILATRWSSVPTSQHFDQHLWLQTRFPHVLTAKSMVKRIPRFFQSPAAWMVVEKKTCFAFRTESSNVHKCSNAQKKAHRPHWVGIGIPHTRVKQSFLKDGEICFGHATKAPTKVFRPPVFPCSWGLFPFQEARFQGWP